MRRTGALPADRGGLSTGLVLAVWLAMLAWAHVYVATCAARFPFADDVYLWALIPPSGSLSWDHLWRLHNEHRAPLPRLVQLLAYQLGGDIRSGMHLQVLILGAVSLGMIALARALRGRTSWTDAVFPLLWLHTGNAENLLCGWQLVLTVPTALVCVILAAAAISPDNMRPSRALATGLALVCLPLCGGAGLTQVPPLAAWTACAGWAGSRSAEARERRAGWILLASVALVAAIGAAYFRGFAHPFQAYTLSPGHVVPMATAVLALALGPAAASWWPASGALVLAVLAATLVLLARRLARDPAERLRAAGILASITGTLCLAASIAIARTGVGLQAGFSDRYVTLTAPLLCSAFLAWTLYGGRRGGTLACAGLALAALAAWPQNARRGRDYGETRLRRAEELEELVRRQADVGPMVVLYSRAFLLVPEHSRQLLKLFAEERRPPFDRGPAPPASAFDWPSMRTPPSRVESSSPATERVIDGDLVLVVQGPSEVRLPLRGGEKKVSGRFAIPRELVAKGRGRLRVEIGIARADGTVEKLYERALDAAAVESDLGWQTFEVALPDHAGGEVVLRTEDLDRTGKDSGWIYWSRVIMDSL